MFLCLSVNNCRLTRNYLMCSEISSKFRNYSKRTFYYIWDLETLIQESSQGVRELKMKAYSTYKVCHVIGLLLMINFSKLISRK